MCLLNCLIIISTLCAVLQDKQLITPCRYSPNPILNFFFFFFLMRPHPLTPHPTIQRNNQLICLQGRNQLHSCCWRHESKMRGEKKKKVKRTDSSGFRNKQSWQIATNFVTHVLFSLKTKLQGFILCQLLRGAACIRVRRGDSREFLA